MEGGDGGQNDRRKRHSPPLCALHVLRYTLYEGRIKLAYSTVKRYAILKYNSKIVVRNVQACYITLYGVEYSEIHGVACRLDQGVLGALPPNCEKVAIIIVMSTKDNWAPYWTDFRAIWYLRGVFFFGNLSRKFKFH